MEFYAGYEIQVSGMRFVNDSSRLFPDPANSYNIQSQGELCEGMGLAYLIFQMGTEDLHMGGMSVIHHLNSRL